MNETPIAIAFLDANVLYPALLRNSLMRLALHGLFRAHWSAHVQEEWMTALLRDRPDLSRSSLNRTRLLMETHIEDALVEGYEHRIEALTLPDADDRHVLAAAVHCGAGVIVTTKLRHFPAHALAPHGITAIHPDAFIVGLLEDDPGTVLAALRKLRASFKNPPMTSADLLAMMKKRGLEATADALGVHAAEL